MSGRIVFKVRKVQECLRKHGVVYTVRTNNKKEGEVTIYFGKHKVAKGVVKKVGNLSTTNLRKYIHLSGFKDVKEWWDKIDEIFLFRGLTREGYSDLAIYEVRVLEWLESPLGGVLCEQNDG